TNIGAGRVVYQELTSIDKAISDGDFFSNPILNSACDACADGNALHIMGLLSDGGVHSHINHIFALLELAKRKKLQKVFIHCFMDGRDTAPNSGVNFLRQLYDKCAQLGIGSIATVSGRYYAMDRDKRYERLKNACDAIILGEGVKTNNFFSAIEDSYKNHVTDEFIIPLAAEDYMGINENDSVIFANFRPDRAREITRAITDKSFDGFKALCPKLSEFVCMTQYDETMQGVKIAFPKEKINDTLSDVLENNGKTQLRIAETEKYAHVTFFFNGGVETLKPHEKRELIPSPKVATYDLMPQMSAFEVANKLLEHINNDCPDVIILNFANCDMVGHTGVFEAAKSACEAVDACLGMIVPTILKLDGIALITADHGNADEMMTEDNKPMTAHSLNPVPFITVGLNKPMRCNGVLADIAPTMLEILNLDKPKAMTGKSLFI
ncbi:MAG: 2,3-bisphosphoglycerate-independent phosphoglycerate mutase, partial [Oscillospiraceae bacterium]